MSTDQYTHRPVAALGGRALHRMGIACNYGIGPADLEHAFERGVQYVYWGSLRTGSLRPTLRAALQRDRKRYVVATGPLLAYFGGSVRRACESRLRELGTDYLDVFQLNWAGVTSAVSEGTLEALQKLKSEGKVRAIGVSIHDRPRAGRLAEDSPLDLFMIRYNAAHPGAEKEIFPHLAKRGPAVVAYTATSWRKLLKAPSGYTGKVPTAGDCYRFCLSSPHVDLALMGPANRTQLDENLDALARGPLDEDEQKWMRGFGKAVHG